MCLEQTVARARGLLSPFTDQLPAVFLSQEAAAHSGKLLLDEGHAAAALSGMVMKRGSLLAAPARRLRCTECGGPLQSVKPWRQADILGKPQLTMRGQSFSPRWLVSPRLGCVQVLTADRC